MGVTKPWSVQISLVEGCNRLCTFCGLNGIRSSAGGYEFMNEITAHCSAGGIAALCPGARVEFAMHGEPTMHPDFIRRVQLFRSYLPKAQFMLTTNGRKWLRRVEQRAEEAFRAGIDIIVLDTYEPERLRLQQEAFAIKSFRVLDFYGNEEGPSPWNNHLRNVRRTLIVVDDIGERTGEKKNRTLMNHAGNAKDDRCPPTVKPLSKTCTLPFREVTICHNGDFNICCMDWGHEYTCGNVQTSSLHDICFCAAFMAARRALGSKNRGFSPCDRCNAGSGSRSGLLPKLSPPKPKDLDVFKKVHTLPQRNRLKRKIWPELVSLCEGEKK